jgi:hypothetical protein
MAATETGFGDRQAARRQLVKLAGTLVLVLVVINVIALYGLDRIRREAEAYAKVTERLIETTDLAREAQVAFKTQVQEWKNVLLRGHDPKDLLRYRDAFHGQEGLVEQRLGQVRERVAELGMATDAVDTVLALHADLKTRYAAALDALDPGTPEAAWRTDRSVRGMDRPLTEAFDTLVARVRELAAARRQAVEAKVEAMTALQRNVLIGVHAAGIALVLLTLVLALRALRRR